MPSPEEPKRHILAINHSPEVLGLLIDLVEAEGYCVTARAFIDRDLSEFNTCTPDLIVIDYMWPTDDDNWSLLQLLRMNPTTKHIPIILCTGAVREAQALESHLFEMGIRIIFKPFDVVKLLDLIATSLRNESKVPSVD